jgi:hypothetical protein
VNASEGEDILLEAGIDFPCRHARAVIVKFHGEPASGNDGVDQQTDEHACHAATQRLPHGGWIATATAVDRSLHRLHLREERVSRKLPLGLATGNGAVPRDRIDRRPSACGGVGDSV